MSVKLTKRPPIVIITSIPVLLTLCGGANSRIESQVGDISSYEAFASPLSTSYGAPAAEPLDSYEAAEDSIYQASDISDNTASDGTASDMAKGDDNLSMLMSSIPGVPGADYPVLADVLSAGDTAFVCQGRIPGGGYSVYLVRQGEYTRRWVLSIASRAGGGYQEVGT